MIVKYSMLKYFESSVNHCLIVVGEKQKAKKFVDFLTKNDKINCLKFKTIFFNFFASKQYFNPLCLALRKDAICFN